MDESSLRYFLRTILDTLPPYILLTLDIRYLLYTDMASGFYLIKIFMREQRL